MPHDSQVLPASVFIVIPTILLSFSSDYTRDRFSLTCTVAVLWKLPTPAPVW